MNTEVDLTKQDLWIAGNIGLGRHISSLLSDSMPNAGNWRGDEYESHFLGAVGELAFAKALGIPYQGTVNTFKTKGDVGGYEIRCRRDLPNYELYVRLGESEERIFVLVKGERLKFRLIGWITGKEAKAVGRFEAHGAKNKAYYVQTNRLHPIHTLPPAPKIAVPPQHVSRSII